MEENLRTGLQEAARASTDESLNGSPSEPTIIRPGEPGYAELAPDIDALGGRPMSLTAGLRFVESEIRKLQKLQEQGYENTIPELADGSGGEIASRSIAERLAELEKMLSDMQAAIVWAEKTRPGSSKNENGSLLLEEYEEATGKKI